MTQVAGTVVSFTAVRYSGARTVLGAAHMATQRPLLAHTSGLRFFKLMGMGSGIGFSARPDLRCWALLCAWSSREDWERFRAGSRVMNQYRDRGDEVYSLLLQPQSGHGRWDGGEPWPLSTGGGAGSAPPVDGPVAVLTRASLRLTRALRFWSMVPAVDSTLRDHPDLLLTFGVGETPWLHQATLSVWRSLEAMKSWAYRTGHHREVVRRTRAEGWYREELFARFGMMESYGTFRGVDPLAGVLVSA